MDLGVQLTSRIDSKLRDKASAMGFQDAGSTKAFMDMLGEGNDYPEIVNLRKEIGDWVSTFKVPWEQVMRHTYAKDVAVPSCCYLSHDVCKVDQRLPQHKIERIERPLSAHFLNF